MCWITSTFPANMESPKDTHDIPEGEICFKCKTKITHVPYKFEGNFFHARCLVCNTCGKRLIGKPFLTANSEIFCNNKCLELYDSEGPKLQPSVEQVQSPNPLLTHHQVATNSLQNIDSFSLNGLLETMQHRTYLYQGYDYNGNRVTEGRVTDYPVAAMSNQNHSFQSETDSLSTMSESSFTSDSSFAYDANRKPKKKILKKSSNGPRIKHKKRVRWNFENIESFSDIDSVSMDSSSSLSSNGRSYQRAQDLAFHYVNNGHEPPRGVTKTTSDYPYRQQSTGKVLSPPSSSLPPQYSNGVNGTSQHHRGIYRTFSGSIYHPKTTNRSPHHHSVHYNTSLDNPEQRNRSMSESYQDLPRGHIIHSSPLPNQIRSSSSSLNRSMDRIINIPVLQLEDVPELNDSIPEERHSHNLFVFPRAAASSHSQTTNRPDTHQTVPNSILQRSRSNSDISNPQSLTSNSSSSISSQSTSSFTPVSTFLPIALRGSSPADSPPISSNQFSRNFPLKRVPENDDEPDYDHLDNEESPTVVCSGPAVKELLNPLEPDNQWYSSDDIDEALEIIEGSEHEIEEKPSPPPLPPKQRHQNNHTRPPVPPKKHVLNSILAQEVSLDDTCNSHNGSINHLIISPPQGFRGSNIEYSRQDPLHSPSSETLMPANDTSQSDTNLTPMESEIHPEARLQSSPLKHSWSKTIEERVIEGAEDPHQNRQSPTTTCIPVDPSTGFVPTTNKVYTDTKRSHKLDRVTNGIEDMNMADDPLLQRHNSFSPKRSREDQPMEAGLHRSKTLPRNLTLTKEDKAVLQWYRQRPQMKPVIVDTDREIDDMMAEMERDKDVVKRRSPRQSLDHTQRQKSLGNLGTCFTCKKPINDTNSLVDFASRTYHSSCFCCSHCRCLLKGTQIYTLQGVLMCYSDYNMAITKQQTEQLTKIHKIKNKRSLSSSSLTSSKSREDIVISPPMQPLDHSYNKNTTMV